MFSEFSFSKNLEREAAEVPNSTQEVNEVPLPDNIQREIQQSNWENPPEPEIKVGFLGEQEDKTVPPVINNDGIIHETEAIGIVSLQVRRSIDPHGYPKNEFRSSPSLTPPKARVSTSDTAGGIEKSSSSAGQVWVRLDPGEPRVSPKEPDSVSDLVKRPHTLNIGDALSQISAPKATIELFARPAPEELHRKAMLDARIRASQGDKTATSRIEELTENVVQTGILVSSTPDKIDEAVSAVKRALVDKGRSAEVVVPQGQTNSPEETGIVQRFFSSREDALRHPGETGSIRPTAQFADLVASAWPQKSVPGLDIGKAPDFAQKIGEAHSPGPVVGKVYDRAGKEIGPFVMPK